MRKLRGLFILNEADLPRIYGPAERRDIAEYVDEIAPPLSSVDVAERPELLATVEVIFSGWGGPLLDEAFLDAAPNLRAVFYGAGSMASLLTPAVWERAIAVTSALAANAVPVAEYALSTILFSLKHGWRLARQTKEMRHNPDRNVAPGCYGTTVGVISLGTIARTLLKLLRPFDLRVLVFDPYLIPAEAKTLGVEQVTLAELFAQSDVVSLHAPLFPETVGLVTGAHLAAMKHGATFINTARGQLVCEQEMIGVLRDRPDLQAVLDVTAEEPAAPDSPLYDLSNVLLTPHIAGSVGNECRRMGRYMVEELGRFVAGEPLMWSLTPALVERSSHRPVGQPIPRPQLTVNRITSKSATVAAL